MTRLLTSAVLALLSLFTTSCTTTHVPAPLLYSEQKADRTIARAGDYFVVNRVEDQSGVAMLCKTVRSGDPEVVAVDEDIIPQIEHLVPPPHALELARQIVGDEIKRIGGPEKMQESIDKTTKESGAAYFSYLTPLSIAAYRIHGVRIPKAE
jgi:hypothetical protein